MITKKYIAVCFAITILFNFSGCDQKVQDPVEFGHFDNNRYQNDLFGLTIELPEDWYVLSKQQIAAMTGVANLVAGDDDNLKKQYKKHLQRTSMLLTAFMYPIPKTDGYNPSFGCTAENMKFYPGIKSGKDFLELLKNTQSSGQVRAKFPEQIQEVEINDTKFYVNDNQI